jgi:hypothetical protein
MKLPRVRHRKGKYLGKNLWECTDARAKEIPAFEIVEGGNGGGGYKYLGYQNPILKVDKNTARMIRKASRVNEQKEERQPRTKKMDKAFEMDQIKKAVDAIMNSFGKYKLDCDLNWPVCYIHQTEMCQVIKKGENTYYQCFEINDEGKPCFHREYGI